MTGVAGVMALVLAETVAGATLFLWVSPLWNEVKRGFFKLLGAILTVLAGLAWLSVDAAVVGRFPFVETYSGRRRWWQPRATALWTVLLFARQQAAARVVGLLSVPAWIAVLVWMGGAGRQSFGLALFQLAAGAALLGAATDGLLLGHWYLTDRKLPRGPINRMTTILMVSVVARRRRRDQRGFLRRRGVGGDQPVAHGRCAGAVDRPRHGRRDGSDRVDRSRRSSRVSEPRPCSRPRASTTSRS